MPSATAQREPGSEPYSYLDGVPPVSREDADVTRNLINERTESPWSVESSEPASSASPEPQPCFNHGRGHHGVVDYSSRSTAAASNTMLSSPSHDHVQSSSSEMHGVWHRCGKFYKKRGSSHLHSEERKPKKSPQQGRRCPWWRYQPHSSDGYQAQPSTSRHVGQHPAHHRTAHCSVAGTVNVIDTDSSEAEDSDIDVLNVDAIQSSQVIPTPVDLSSSPNNHQNRDRYSRYLPYSGQNPVPNYQPSHGSVWRSDMQSEPQEVLLSRHDPMFSGRPMPHVRRHANHALHSSCSVARRQQEASAEDHDSDIEVVHVEKGR